MRTHGARPTVYGFTLALVGALLLAACGGSRGAAPGTWAIALGWSRTSARWTTGPSTSRSGKACSGRSASAGRHRDQVRRDDRPEGLREEHRPVRRRRLRRDRHRRLRAERRDVRRGEEIPEQSVHRRRTSSWRRTTSTRTGRCRTWWGSSSTTTRPASWRARWPALMTSRAPSAPCSATDAVPPVYRFGEGYRAGAKSRESGGQRGRRLPQRRGHRQDVHRSRVGQDDRASADRPRRRRDLRRGRQDGQRRADRHGRARRARHRRRPDQYYTVPEAARGCSRAR